MGAGARFPGTTTQVPAFRADRPSPERTRTSNGGGAFMGNGNVVPLAAARGKSRLTAQESASVLKGCRELALDRMAAALSGMLDRVEDELFTLAEKAGDRDA